MVEHQASTPGGLGSIPNVGFNDFCVCCFIM